jgi:hypothetical protein
MIKLLLLTLTLSFSVMAQLTNTQKQELIAKNLLKNAGGENNIANWTASAGTFAHTTTASQIGFGKGALSWDAAADADTLRSNAVAIPAGAYGKNGVAFCSFKGASAVTHEIGVYDGTNELASLAITSSTDKFETSYAPFIFPSSGNIQLQIKAKANEAALYIDDCFLGLAEGTFLSNVSQAGIYGTARYDSANNCVWSTTSTSKGTFAADTDCTAPVVTGKAAAPGTRIPGITFTNLPPAKYEVTITGNYQSSTNGCVYSIYDGTTYKAENYMGAGSGMDSRTAVFEYTTSQSSVTFQVGAKAETGATCTLNNSIGGVYGSAGDIQVNIVVKKFPLDSQQAATFSTSGWLVDASIGGANIDLGTSAVSSYAEMSNSGLDLVNNTSKGSDSSVLIACNSTNTASGLTCSSGNETNGISFVVPRAGTYRACVEFGYANSHGSASITTFQIVETALNSTTILQEGGGRQAGGTGVTSGFQNNYVSTCGIFNFSSSGRKELNVFFEKQDSTTQNVIADRASATGQRDIYWTVYPLTQNFPAPIINNSITSNSSGALRLEVAKSAPLCTSSPCAITYQSGSWLTSISRHGTGLYRLNIASGIFSTTPVCTINSVRSNLNMFTDESVASTTRIDVYAESGSVDTGFDVTCVGAR